MRPVAKGSSAAAFTAIATSAAEGLPDFSLFSIGGSNVGGRPQSVDYVD
jgi:hypothetical protein